MKKLLDDGLHWWGYSVQIHKRCYSECAEAETIQSALKEDAECFLGELEHIHHTVIGLWDRGLGVNE